MSDTQSRVVGTAIALETPDGQKALVADITIECEVCGSHRIRFAGHHLRAIRDFLADTIDEFPELTLKAEQVNKRDVIRFKGPANDPRTG